MFSVGCIETEQKQNLYDMSTFEYGVGYDYKGEKFYFDKEDYDLISNYCWNKSSKGYIVAQRPQSTQLHRLVMGVSKESDIRADHINLDKSDNRKSNLRLVTDSQNRMNTRTPKNNTSGIKGVCFVKSRNQWCAYIGVNKKRITIGRYDNIDDAILARKKAEKLYFGKYNYSEEKDYLTIKSCQ